MTQPGWMEADHWPGAAGSTAVAVANGPGKGHLTGTIPVPIITQQCTRCPCRQAYHRTGSMSTGGGPQRQAAPFILPLLGFPRSLVSALKRLRAATATAVSLLVAGETSVLMIRALPRTPLVPYLTL